jgi:hypothetical protein
MVSLYIPPHNLLHGVRERSRSNAKKVRLALHVCRSHPVETLQGVVKADELRGCTGEDWSLVLWQ